MEIPLHPSCRLVRADPSGLMAIEKATGILSHPNSNKDTQSAVLTVPYDLEREAFTGDGKEWFLLNRLDGPTSGLLLLADNIELAGLVKEAFARHRVEKTYHAAVKGIPGRKRDSWRDFLGTARKRGILRTEVKRGRPNAETRMELVQRGSSSPARSLITLRPLTGRTHQLRVQCASRFLPIIGDSTYGDYAFNREFRRNYGEKRLFLHSSKVRLEVEYSGRKLVFSAESELPEAFTIALQ